MAIEAGAVKVSIGVDASGLNSGLRDAARRMDRAAGGMSDSLAEVGRTARRVGAIIGAAMAAGIGLAIREAANAEEISSKFDAVFRDSADSVREWARVTADATARSSIAFEEYLSTFQDTFVPLGFARAEAAEFSQTLTQLAVDLASFNNESEPETVRALQSALVGNHETVRRYGVIINEAGIEQELLNMGIRGGKDAATAAQVAMARLNIIMAGTSDAQGDAARTSDSLTNQWKALTAELRDSAVAIGQSFMPAARVMLSWARDMVPILERVGVALGNALNTFGRQFAQDQFSANTVTQIDSEIAALTQTIDSYWESIRGGGRRTIAFGPLRSFLGADEVERLAAQGNITSTSGQLEIVGLLQKRIEALTAAREGLSAATEDDTATTTGNTAAANLNLDAIVAEKDWLDELAQARGAEADAAIEAMKAKNVEMAESLTRFTIDAQQAGDMVTGAIGGAFDKMARGVKVTFRDLAQEILAIFARIAFNNLIAGPVSQFASNLFGGGGGGIGGAIAGALGTTASAAAVAPSAKGGASSQTIINIDAKYASQGTAEMIVAKIQEAAPALIKQSSNVAVQTMNQTQRARSAF